MDEICKMTVDSGQCTNYIDMFYYDTFTAQCQSFIYGGCGGNRNRYRTKEECFQRCGHLSGADQREYYPSD
jgi:hypothetical protein